VNSRHSAGVERIPHPAFVMLLLGTTGSESLSFCARDALEMTITYRNLLLL
jgi:hypothetical protein